MAFYYLINIPVIIMNPQGNNWHNPDEIDSLYTLYNILKTFLDYL